MLCSNQSRAILTSSEIEPFDGKDITQYNFFILSFERAIEQRCIDPIDKYYSLLKYTKGQANELVKSCSGLDPKSSYDLARKTLKETYGNEYNISNCFLEKLENWPQVENEDSEGLEDLATFLRSCLNMMQSMSSLNQLNSLKEICDITSKLPFDLRKQFRRLVGREVELGNQINFKTLVDFVNMQSKLLKLPLLGNIKNNSKKDQPKNKAQDRKKIFSTSASYATNSNNLQHNASKKCPCCAKSNHELNDCIFFNKKSMSEREEFIKKNRLCFGCLLVGHSSRVCSNRLQCNRCNKNHPTCLHRTTESTNTENVHNFFQQASDEASQSTTASSQDGEEDPQSEQSEPPEARSCNLKVAATSASNEQRIVCAAVPVYVRIKGNNRKICTYMGMDSFASDVFMDMDLMKQLATEGIDKTLSLTTMERKHSQIKTKLI